MKSAAPKLQPAHDCVPLIGKSLDELRELAASLGEPSYRGAQIYRELYARRQTRIEKMTALPAEMRRRIAETARVGLPEIARRHRSADGTVRYVLRCTGTMTGMREEKTAAIETVFMPEEKRQTICISTQEGCAVNCQFCLTATLGLVRNLTAGEIVGQILVALEDNRETLKPQTNVVLMGQGEPLLNYEAVMKALTIILDPKGLGISPKHATLSTSGIVPGIEKLAKDKDAAEAGDFAECFDGRTARRDHAGQPKISDCEAAGGLPELSVASVGASDVRICSAGRIQ
ncbi:MAG: radical SAM protein [Candidatus Acidiferrales bacterium]